MTQLDQERRIAQLETALRRQRNSMMAVVAAVGCALACGFNPPEVSASPGVVQASRFELLDSHGSVSAILSHNPETGASLVLNSAGGTPSCSLESTEDGGAVFVMDAKGDVVGSLGAQSDGGSFYLHDRSGQEVCVLQAREEGGAMFIKNTAGQEMCAIGSDKHGGVLHIKEPSGVSAVLLGAEDGDGYLRLNADSGQPTCILGSDESEGGFMKVLNAADKSVCDIGCSETGSVYFFLRNKDQEAVMSVTTLDGDGALSVYGAGEKELFSVLSGPDGNGWLQLCDREGKVWVEAEIDSNGGSVTTRGTAGEESILAPGR